MKTANSLDTLKDGRILNLESLNEELGLRFWDEEIRSTFMLQKICALQIAPLLTATI